MSRASLKKLAILTVATLVSSCTGGSSPRPPAIRSPLFRMQTAAELEATVQKATQGLHGCRVPPGAHMYEATSEVRCVFDGEFVQFLSFAPYAAPTALPGLQGPTVLFAPTWIVIAGDLAQAQTIQRVIGGRLHLTPVLVISHSVTEVGPGPRNCPGVAPIGCAVRFRVSVRDPLDRQAVFLCRVHGLSANGKVLFRKAERVKRPTDAGVVAELSGVARVERSGTFAKGIAWCYARPVTQPQ